MIFTDDDFTYIPDYLYLQHSSPWVDENGNNTPLYNHVYWEHHKDEIMARRRLLEAGADPDSGSISDEDAAAYTTWLQRNVQDYITSRGNELTDEDRIMLGQELKAEIDKVNSRKQKPEEDKAKPATTPAKTTDSDDSDSKKKKKGSSSGSSGSSSSSKSSSSKGGKAGGTENDGSHAKSSKVTSNSPKATGKGGSASKEKAEKATKEKAAAKEKSGSGKEKASAEKNSKNADNKKNQAPSEDNSEMSVAFSKIKETGYEAGQEPVNSYASFIKELRQSSSYQVNDADSGLALWREYRKRKGLDTSDALLEKHRASAEDDIARRRTTLQHGLDLFDAAILEHHGILGMHWGVQNGPPYPLDADAHSQSEKKANWQQSLSKGASKVSKAIYEGSMAVGRGVGAAAKGTGRLAKGTADTIRKQRVAAAEKKQARADAKKKAEEEAKAAEHRNAIATGNTKYAEEHFSDMTDQEVKDLINRVDLKEKLDKADGSYQKTFTDQLKDVSKNIDDYRSIIKTGVDSWNQFATIYNSFAVDKLPVIDGDAAKRIREKRQRELYTAMLADPSLITYRNLSQLDDSQRKGILETNTKVLTYNKMLRDQETANATARANKAKEAQDLADAQKKAYEDAYNEFVKEMNLNASERPDPKRPDPSERYKNKSAEEMRRQFAQDEADAYRENAERNRRDVDDLTSSYASERQRNAESAAAQAEMERQARDIFNEELADWAEEEEERRRARG